jgi:hypothetical protein
MASPYRLCPFQQRTNTDMGGTRSIARGVAERKMFLNG